MHQLNFMHHLKSLKINNIGFLLECGISETDALFAKVFFPHTALTTLFSAKVSYVDDCYFTFLLFTNANKEFKIKTKVDLAKLYFESNYNFTNIDDESGLQSDIYDVELYDHELE